MDTVILAPGDPCPVCKSDFEMALVPTAEQRAGAADRDNQIPLPPNYDTMSARDRMRHGGLFRCVRCGYNTRFPLVAEQPEPDPPPA